MSGDLPATRAHAVVHPLTGEVLDLAGAGTDELAAFRDDALEAKRLIDSTLVDVDSELAARLDRDNVRSARVGAFELKVDSPLEVVWDAGELGIVLEALVQTGRLTRPAAEKALERVVTHKPRARELDKLLGHPDAEVRDAIAQARTVKPRARRRVSVHRAAPAQRRLTAPEPAEEATE